MERRPRHAAMIVFRALLAVLISTSAVAGASIGGGRGLDSGPDNTAVLGGETVVLRCRTDGVVGANARWYEFVTTANPAGEMITDGTTVIPSHPNAARYGVLHPDSVTYDLQISPTVWADGGYYKCVDSNADPPSIVELGAQLIIMESLPNCTTTIPTHGFVKENAYHTSECEVHFKASLGIAPIMTWAGPQPFDSGSRTTNDSVASTMEFNADRAMSAQNWRCTTNFTADGFAGAPPGSATNAPTWSHTYQGNQIFVQWPPGNMTATPLQANYEIGQEITCWTDANPGAEYKWQSMQSSEWWYSDRFTCREDMVGYQLMRCTATNTIQGINYTKDYFLDVYVNAKTTTAVPTTPSTTTPTPDVAPCNDLTGRWEATFPNVSLCLTVDHENDGRLIGMMLNGSSTYWLQLTGRTRIDHYDELGWAIIWPSSSIGVSAYAAECHSCYGVETMLANAISRTTKDSAFCGGGHNVFASPLHTFHRVPTSWPCSSSVRQMRANMQLAAQHHLRAAAFY